MIILKLQQEYMKTERPAEVYCCVTVIISPLSHACMLAARIVQTEQIKSLNNNNAI